MNAKVKQFLFLVAVALFWFSQYVYTSYFTPYMTSLGIAASLAGTIVGAYGFTQLVLRIPFCVAAGVDPDLAAQDACRIEHDLSPETFEVIKRYIGKYGEE